jgi:flavin-dependent dehydrogenase
MQSVDVVIVGAGLAGLQTARLLSRQGLRVLLADRKSALDKTIHTTGIFVRKTLEDFDLPESCLGPVVRRAILYSPARRPLLLESPYDEFRVGKMGSLYLNWLQDCQQLGVIWAPASTYRGCVVSAIGSRVTFVTGEREWQVETRYLVGADGTLSRVARQLHLDVNRKWIMGVEDVLHGIPAPGQPCFHCFLDPRLAPGYIAWLTHDGEEVHLGVGGYANQFKPLQALQIFRESVQDLMDFSQARVVQRRGGCIPVGGVLHRLANPRGLVVGDAAGAPSPLTAGGLDPCLRLSSFAAQVITDYLATGNSAALQAYSGHRFRSRFVSRLWMRRLLSVVEHPSVLEIACGMMRLPVFQPLAWQVMFGRGSFPDVEWVPASHSLA